MSRSLRSRPAVPSAIAVACAALALMFAPTGARSQARAGDRIAEMQADAYNTAKVKKDRPYHFGSQGPGDVFSNHGSHTNRLIPFYTFGRKIDPKIITGANSTYRNPDKIRALYGVVPPNTLNPAADYADQADLYALQKDAVAKGVKHLFILWFDGMDWQTTQAAAIHKSGKVYTEGRGHGLAFLDETAEGSTQFGSYVTSPTHDANKTDMDAQTVTIPAESLLGGYDAEIAGPNPWTLGPLGPKAPGYLKGQSGDARDKAGVAAVGRVMHAYTDSSTSAAEAVSGVKSYNNSINVDEQGKPIKTLFHELQGQGWKVGTVTSVPFPHASPAAMYARNVDRDDYQDIARDMFGLDSILTQTGKASRLPGLDVVMGTGFNQLIDAKNASKQGKNGAVGNAFLAPDTRKAIDVKNGGQYVVVETTRGTSGKAALAAAAERAARANGRLFGFFGNTGFNHLPYATADGNFDPVKNANGKGESYSKADLFENPTLADMTQSALKVLAKPGQKFALFIEAGDVDFGLHDNNLDNAIGAVYSGDAAVKAVFDWIKAHSNWDDSAVIVTADHGHYLVIDKPEALK